MFNRVIFQRIVLILIVLASLVLFTTVAFRYDVTSLPTLTAPVAKGATITQANIRVIQYPSNALINFESNLIKNAADLEGRVASVPILAGVPLTTNLFGDADSATRDPRYPKASELDTNLIKYFVPTDLKSSQGGVIRPDDYVNVIYQDPTAQTATFVLQKIHVVGARTMNGNNTDGGAGGTAAGGGLINTNTGGSAATKLTIAGYLLAVTPQQALLLAPLNPANIRLVQVPIDWPELPGVPAGFGTSSSSASPTVSPAP